MIGTDKMGRDEGSKRGPRPGDGATIANPAAGGSDMEGTPPDALPDQRGRAASDKAEEEAEEEPARRDYQAGGRLPLQPSGKTPPATGH